VLPGDRQKAAEESRRILAAFEALIWSFIARKWVAHGNKERHRSSPKSPRSAALTVHRSPSRSASRAQAPKAGGEALPGCVSMSPRSSSHMTGCVMLIAGSASARSVLARDDVWWCEGHQ